MKLLRLYRGWRDALIAAHRIIKQRDVSPSEAFKVYGGSALPTGALFARELLNHRVGNEMLTGSRPMTMNALNDRNKLLAMPRGSLGRVYAETFTGAFEDAEDIRVQEDFGHQERGGWNKPQGDEQLIAHRLMGEIRWQHDLMHIITGYGTDFESEIALQAFLISHVRLPAPKIFAIFGFWSFPHTVFSAWRAGRRAEWLFPIDWESLLPLPLYEVRYLFNVEAAI